MADNKTVDNGALTDIPVATAEATFSGDTVDVQLVSLAVISGNEGARTADFATGDTTNGMLVNLGTNNDVTVTSLPATAAEAAALPAVFTVVAGDDGTDTHPLQLSATGRLKTTLDYEPVLVENAGNFAVIATNLDIRSLELGTDAVKVGDGTNLINVDTAPADGESNTKNLVCTESFSYGFNGTTWDRLRADTTNGLLVNLGTNNDVTVTGSVTANAGTNLNTSLLALESGGNLASAVTALQLIDDGVATVASAITTKGMAAAGTDGTNARILKTDTDGELQVDVLTLPAITGSVTANAGTNLNTSALALETGGNLAGAATSLAILDDWDETDRAKVNLIVGQAGIAAGAGAVGATVPRVTHASDDPVTTSVQLIDDVIFADDAGFTIGTSKVAATGGYAVAHGSNPDAADAADAGVFLMNRHRIPFMLGGHPNIQSAEYYTTGSQTDDTIMPAIAGGTKYVITYLAVIASAANTVNTSVRIGFGTASVPSQGASGADATTKVVLSHPNIPAGSGITKGNGCGIIGIGGDGEELRITCSAPTTGSLIVQVDYFTIES